MITHQVKSPNINVFHLTPHGPCNAEVDSKKERKSARRTPRKTHLSKVAVLSLSKESSSRLSEPAPGVAGSPVGSQRGPQPGSGKERNRDHLKKRSFLSTSPTPPALSQRTGTFPPEISYLRGLGRHPPHTLLPFSTFSHPLNLGSPL